MDIFKEFIDKNFKYAVVGASNNREKYGNRVFRDLKAGGYDVVPVNLKEDSIEGFKNYHTLSEIESKPDIVVFVIPPEAALKVLEEVKMLGINKTWFQPGSESVECAKYCNENNILNVMDKCIMVVRKLKN